MNTSISSSVNELIEEERPAWLDLFLKVSQFYTIPILCCCGIIFNCSSVGVLLSNILHLHRSLVVLFSFLNISDTCFLICTFMVFGLPNVSQTFKVEYAGHWIPYILPALQTFLTISVYSTVAIAINGAMEVTSFIPDQHGSTFSKIVYWLEAHHFNGLTFSIIGILLFSVVFNLTRWFEVTTDFIYDKELNQTIATPVNTLFREHPGYVLFYSMLGSTLIMVIIPTIVLITSCVILMRAIPEGLQRKKILRIMLVIILMFIICHVPKVILTGYEIANLDRPPTFQDGIWAQVLKEISHILLVCYSAFNPIACCGELLLKSLIVPIFNLCGQCFLKKTYVESEMIQMKSIGVTVNRSAINDQLEELDPQSKLLKGLERTHPIDREKSMEEAKPLEISA